MSAPAVPIGSAMLSRTKQSSVEAFAVKKKDDPRLYAKVVEPNAEQKLKRRATTAGNSERRLMEKKEAEREQARVRQQRRRGQAPEESELEHCACGY